MNENTDNLEEVIKASPLAGARPVLGNVPLKDILDARAGVTGKTINFQNARALFALSF